MYTLFWKVHCQIQLLKKWKVLNIEWKEAKNVKRYWSKLKMWNTTKITGLEKCACYMNVSTQPINNTKTEQTLNSVTATDWKFRQQKCERQKDEPKTAENDGETTSNIYHNGKKQWHIYDVYITLNRSSVL